MGKKSIKVNAILNMIKQLCSVIFPLVTVPYVSRILGSEYYGRYNFGNSVIGYFTLLAGLGIANYAIREGARIRDNTNKIAKFSNEVFSINIISTVVSYIVLFILLLFSVQLHNYRLLILVQSTSILLTTLGADWINSIYEDYFYITVRYIGMQTIAMLLLFMVVRQPEDYIKYAVVTVIASAGGNIFNIFYVRRYVHLHFTLRCNFKLHFKPIMLLFCNAIAGTIYVNSDTTILGILQTESAVGIYSLSTKIYLVIKQVLNAVIMVSLPRLSALLAVNDIENYKKISNKIMNALCTIIFPAIVGLFILSEKCILIVGGEQYIAGANALKILSIAAAFAVLACFYSCAIMLPFRQEKICLIASLVSALVNIVLNFVVIPMWSYNGAALTTLISEMIVFLIYKYYSKDYPKVGFNPKIIGSTAIGCIAIIIVCRIVENMFSGLYLVTFFSILMSSIVYFIIQIIMGNALIVNVLKTIIKKIR